MATSSPPDGCETPPGAEGGERRENAPVDAPPDASHNSQPTPANGNKEPEKEKLHSLIADLTRMIQETRVSGEKTREDSLCQIRDILESLLHKPIIDSLAKNSRQVRE